MLSNSLNPVNQTMKCEIRLWPIHNPGARQVRLHLLRADGIVQGYSQATPALQTYAALILAPGDTSVQVYWNTSRENQ